jgi:molecular chaperone DnaK (HSP70)
MNKAKADIKITQAVGHLSPGEIERMVQAAEQMKAEDDKVLARLQARNELGQLKSASARVLRSSLTP